MEKHYLVSSGKNIIKQFRLVGIALAVATVQLSAGIWIHSVGYSLITSMCVWLILCSDIKKLTELIEFFVVQTKNFMVKRKYSWY